MMNNGTFTYCATLFGQTQLYGWYVKSRLFFHGRWWDDGVAHEQQHRWRWALWRPGIPLSWHDRGVVRIKWGEHMAIMHIHRPEPESVYIYRYSFEVSNVVSKICVSRCMWLWRKIQVSCSDFRKNDFRSCNQACDKNGDNSGKHKKARRNSDK